MKKKKDTINDRDATDEEIKKEIGRTVKEMRGKLRLSALTVATSLEISREAVTHIETGRNNISGVLLWKLAILFNCEMQDFFPAVPDGYALTKVDLHKVAQESGQKGVKWAEKLFKKKN
jgi:transcriptional regulator with XRE-family HTH domain